VHTLLLVVLDSNRMALVWGMVLVRQAAAVMLSEPILELVAAMILAGDQATGAGSGLVRVRLAVVDRTGAVDAACCSIPAVVAVDPVAALAALAAVVAVVAVVAVTVASRRAAVIFS